MRRLAFSECCPSEADSSNMLIEDFFRVIFTLRNCNDDILAQAVSQSIMITDDHKQPGNAQNNYAMGMMANAGMFPQGFPPQNFNPMPNYMRQNGMHRNSYSSPDLMNFAAQSASNYRNQYNPQRGPPPALSRQASSTLR